MQNYAYQVKSLSHVLIYNRQVFNCIHIHKCICKDIHIIKLYKKYQDKHLHFVHKLVRKSINALSERDSEIISRHLLLKLLLPHSYNKHEIIHTIDYLIYNAYSTQIKCRNSTLPCPHF